MSRPISGPRTSTMRIRAFPNNVDERNVHQTWLLLKTAIQEIQKKNGSGLSFEELYRNAYTMVLHKHGEKLYSGLKEVVEGHLVEHIRFKVANAINGGRFLEILNEAWIDHTTAMVMIRDILMYMDRVYVQQHNVEPVYPLGLSIFRDKVVRQNNVSEHLRATLLQLISDERSGQTVNWTGIKHACQMLVALGIEDRHVYESEFETPFLKESAMYYRAASQKFLSENSASVYVQKVEECIEDEAARAKRYLDPSTEAKILDVLDEELISKHMQRIADMEQSGVVPMLSNDKVVDLSRLYRLLKRVNNGLTVITTAMSRHLRQLGEEIVVEDGELIKTPVNFIQALIDLKEKYDYFLHNAFSNDKVFKHKIQNDFEFFFNKTSKSAEYLSLYMDDKLRKGSKDLNESELEQLLDKSMVLFRFLQEKDAFEKYYKQHLAKRLLLDKSISDEAENSMITKLKTECGCQFTQKLEGMFRDKELWGLTVSDFRTYKERFSPAEMAQKDPAEITVRVLTSGVWPTQGPSPCVLPKKCSTSFKTFTDFYTSKHSGRKITLNTTLGSADIKAYFYGTSKDDVSSQGSSNSITRKEETKILHTSNTYLMIILLLFNKKNKFTFAELADDTHIPEKDLKRNLQSLAMGKATQRILCRKGVGKDIEAQDEFTVNDGFTSKFSRIKIQLVTSKSETEAERKETKNKIDEDRKLEVEAAIVRIMKARKKLVHNLLISEVIDQLKHRFEPSPQLIKKRIEALIEREYLARDEHDQKSYSYI
ncbi:unnamed protein product [Auanema sp. JU1783]|nr:unnamed protein product [Auanema sp. JU1783]